MWDGQLVLSETGWRVIAPHLRGMGGEHRDPPATSIDDYAADVIDLLDGLHVEDAVIGGLSMGGYVTFALFRLAPRYFRGMVLADTRPQADTPADRESRQRMLSLVRDRGMPEVADEVLPNLLAHETIRARPDCVSLVRDLIEVNSVSAVDCALRAIMTRQDSTPVLTSIHCPTLIVVGEHDAITPPSVGRDMLRAVGGSELAVVPKAGHLSNLEQPEAFNAALSRFLAHRV
jgi:pimeloyl-ACP methyl ester carboxylesterase